MANAKKCDRCGVCFDPMTGGDVEYVSFSNPIFRSQNSLKEMKSSRMLFNDNRRIDLDVVDLCPSCTKAFEKFMACEDVFKVEEPKKAPAYKEEDNYFEISADSIDDANMIKQGVMDLWAEYAVVSVGDVYDLIGEESPNGYTDFNYGWRYLESEDIQIRPNLRYDTQYNLSRVKAIVRFPKPVPLADPPGTTINARQEDLDVVAQTAKLFSAARDRISSVFGHSTDDKSNGGDTDGDH